MINRPEKSYRVSNSACD